MPGLYIRHEHAVAALGRERAPDAVTQVELLAVLGVLEVRAEGHAARVMGNGGIEELVDIAFQAGAFAGLCRLCRRACRRTGYLGACLATGRQGEGGQ